MIALMRLDRYASADDFLAAAGDWLAAREAEHNLILGISGSLRRDPDQYESDPYFAVVTDASGVRAAAMRTPPHNLILSEVEDVRALALLADDLAGEPEFLPGVTGPPEAAVGFADRWAATEGGTWRVEIEERIYQLSGVIDPRPTSGAMRLADPGRDADLVQQWVYDFTVEALGEADAARLRRMSGDWTASGRRFWLWEDESRPVALAGTGGETPRGIRIGPVYTPPRFRGRGYASNLTAEVSRRMLVEGRRFCFLYTNLANATANHIYQEIGYRPVTDALMLTFHPAGAQHEKD
jgi:predicted GNAT family acetyltransferase